MGGAYRTLPPIVPAALSDDAGMVGAALLAAALVYVGVLLLAPVAGIVWTVVKGGLAQVMLSGWNTLAFSPSSGSGKLDVSDFWRACRRAGRS